MLPFGCSPVSAGARAALVAIIAAFPLALACEFSQTFAAERSSSVAGLAGGVPVGVLGTLAAVQWRVPIGRGATGIGLLLRRAVAIALCLYLASLR